MPLSENLQSKVRVASCDPRRITAKRGLRESLPGDPMWFDSASSNAGSVMRSGGGSHSRWLFLRVPPEIASALKGGSATPTSIDLQRDIASLGLTLEKRKPESDHPALELWFRADLSGADDVPRVLRTLRRNRSIETATLSPPEEVPIDLFSTGWTIAPPVEMHD
jgi:hypothetical protein